MRRRPFSAGLALALIQLVLLIEPASLPAQPFTPAERDAVIAEIKEYAERHAENSGAMQTQLVLELFRDNAAGLPPQEVARIYEEEYARTKEANEPRRWEPLLPQAGWLVALLLLVWVSFQNLLKKWLDHLFEASGKKLYAWLVGRPFFWASARKRYRRALRDTYAKQPLPFRPNRPLDIREIYVPLKVKGTADADQIEAIHLVSTHHRSVIMGAPGSGKSMLLKHLALSYAEGPLEGREPQPLPVLLSLHRLNDPQTTLADQLVAELERNDFRSARRFVSSALEQGNLLLLLDGLDEVKSDERMRVVRSIQDSWGKCPVVITCRSTIYRHEFDDFVDQTLEIVEFNDQQIRRFLGSWKRDMNKRGRSIEHLMGTLHDRPQLLALARTPLLLTIISYLYTDTDFILPNSRAEFYRTSTDVLLGLWQPEYNQFKASDKRYVLQHLALFHQEAMSTQGQDRLSMERPTVLAQVLKLLPALGRGPESADPLLDEIVQRNGLLLLIDGGERYQFAHLTFQEYFAATRLSDDGKGLLERFQKDPDTWRETAKLWCGLDHDSTELIRTIHQKDPLTAFECLAETRRVDPELANGILEAFKTRLGTTGVDDAVVKVFGAVAAYRSPRGTAAFQMLKEILATARNPRRRIAAANALSLSNLPDAAQVLVGYYPKPAEIRAALVRMGELAAPVLEPLLEERPLEVLDDLLAIGPPQAARILVPRLWHTDKDEAFKAAWWLAALLPKPGVEDLLRHHPLTPQQRKSDYIDWVWQPFNEPENSALPIIAGRVAFLLTQAPVELAPATPQVLDQRLVVPLCAILMRPKKPAEWLTNSAPANFSLNQRKYIERFDAYRTLRNRFFYTTSRRELTDKDIEQVVNAVDPSPTWRFLFKHLPLKTTSRLALALIGFRTPTKTDWKNVFQPVKYEFDTSWRYRMIVGVALLLSVVAVAHATLSISHSPELFSWKNGLLVLAAAFTVLFWVVLPLFGYMPLTDEDDFLEYGLLAPVAAWESLLDFDEVTVAILSLGWLPATGYLVTAAMLTYLPWYQVVLVWVLLLGAGAVLWRAGLRRERESSNLLQGLIERPSAIPTGVRRNGEDRTHQVSRSPGRAVRTTGRAWLLHTRSKSL